MKAQNIRTDEAATGLIPASTTGLAIASPEAWQRPAKIPRKTAIPTGIELAAKVLFFFFSSEKYRVTDTPRKIRKIPAVRGRVSVSLKNSIPIATEKNAWVVNRIPDSRGPSRLKQANSATSPMQIPTAPERHIRIT